MSAPPARRAAFAFIFITVLLDIIALGMIIPVLPKLIASYVGGDTARAAWLLGIFTTLWAVMQFVFSPMLGAASDRFGRRPVVLLSNLGLGIDYIVMALAPNLTWLFAGRILSGITAASIPTAFAYIADVTEPEKRSKMFGMLGIAFGVGFVAGPSFGGLVGGINPHLPFWIAGGLSLLNAVYGTFVLPESLPKDKRSKFQWSRANPMGSFNLLRSNHQLFGLAGVALVANLAHVVFPSVFVLYAGYRFGWGEQAVGLTLGAVGITSMIVQGGLIGPFISRYGERKALLFGLLAGAVGFLFFGFATTAPVFLAALPIMALWGLSGPAIQGLMSRKVDASQQGQLQGAGQSLMAIAEMVGPTVFTGVFAAFIAKNRSWELPGAPFLLASVLLFVALALATVVTRERAVSGATAAGSESEARAPAPGEPEAPAA